MMRDQLGLLRFSKDRHALGTRSSALYSTKSGKSNDRWRDIVKMDGGGKGRYWRNRSVVGRRSVGTKSYSDTIGLGPWSARMGNGLAGVG